jgi:hypothetical protein
MVAVFATLAEGAATYALFFITLYIKPIVYFGFADVHVRNQEQFMHLLANTAATPRAVKRGRKSRNKNPEEVEPIPGENEPSVIRGRRVSKKPKFPSDDKANSTPS